MELRPGYKRTEVGVIPEDWDAKSLGDVAEVVMGQSPVGTSYNRNGIGAALINGPTEFTDEHPIRIQWTSQPTKFSKRGDVLLCVRGSSTGRINISDDEYCIGRGVAAIRAKPETDVSFLAFQTDSAVNGILALTTGSTFPNVDGKSIRSVKVPFPTTLLEQTTIAAALGDVDALIRALDRLITKKRNLKQGAMQQLLTAKTRLPEFSGEWEDVTLGRLGSFSKGRGITREDMVEYGLPCIRYGEIYTRHKDYVREFYSSVRPEVARESQRLHTGDLLFTGSGETAEEIGKCVAFLGNEDAFAGGDIVIFSPVGQDSMFLGYLMNYATIAEQKSRMGQGDAVVHISARSLGSLRFKRPNLPEQKAIASILSDMDAEIAVVEHRRDKTRDIKQGMMQELLTGRTRLI
jgi:type I restriction enzyme, S subunit